MSRLTITTALTTVMTLAVASPLQAAEGDPVDGYAKNTSGETWTSSSGECVRTTFRDSDERPEACGYAAPAPRQAAVESEPEPEAMAVAGGAAVGAGTALPVVAESFTENLEFGLNSAELSAADEAKLDGVIGRLEDHRPLLRDGAEHLNVVGHTDSSGAAAYNQKLSERRAQAVADYLAANGAIGRDAMQVSGKGETDPIGDNATRDGRQMNRRVVIEVIRH